MTLKKQLMRVEEFYYNLNFAFYWPQNIINSRPSISLLRIVLKRTLALTLSISLKTLYTLTYPIHSGITLTGTVIVVGIVVYFA